MCVLYVTPTMLYTIAWPSLNGINHVLYFFSAGHLLANGNKQWSNYTCSYVLIANLFMVYGLFGLKWPFIVAGQHTTHEYSNIGGVHYQPDMVPAGRSTVLLRPAP